MDTKKLKYMEICGVGVTFLIWIALHRTNSMESDHLINLLFGSVNKSSWEMVKTLLLGGLFWGAVELFCAKPYFRAFVAAKTAAIYITAPLYCGIVTIIRSSADSMGLFWESAAILCASSVLHFSSYILYSQVDCLQNYFIPALFLLLLFSVCYVCFTPFPPKTPFFYDYENGVYGIIPPHFDMGAAALDRLYGI